MPHLKIFASLTVFLLLTTACEPFPDENGDNYEIDPCDHQSVNKLLPLTDGNYWVYQDSVHRNIASQPNIVLSTDTSTSIIARMLTVDHDGIEICIGEKVTTSTDSTGRGIEYNWNGPDGLYYLEPDSSADSVAWDNSTLAYSYPAEIDDWWYMGNWTVRLVKTDIEKATPAGTFNCYVYYVSLGTNLYVLHQFFYFAPGVGLVASEAYYIDDAIVYYEYDNRQASDLWIESILLAYNVVE